MLIGVDFDNTIVCYDRIFHAAAVEKGLVPSNLPAAKRSVRDFLLECDRSVDWLELQAYVYGVAIQQALPFPGSREFFLRCAREEQPVRIISHKARHPFRGPAYDLREAAHRWLTQQGFYALHGAGLAEEHVYFEPTPADKVARVELTGCSVMIDDLPEFLQEPGLPSHLTRILFDPTGSHTAPDGVLYARSWIEIERMLFPDSP